MCMRQLHLGSVVLLSAGAAFIIVGLVAPLGVAPFFLAAVLAGWGLAIGLGSAVVRSPGRGLAKGWKADDWPETKDKVEGDYAKASGAPEVCPVCGSRLLRRMAVRGAHRGEQYLACRNWSATGCRFTWGLEVDERFE